MLNNLKQNFNLNKERLDLAETAYMREKKGFYQSS